MQKNIPFLSSFPKSLVTLSLLLAILPVCQLIYAQAVRVERIGIGFSDVKTLSEINEKLNEHNVYPTKIYMWVSGFSGSHSKGSSVTPSTDNKLLSEAKESSKHFFEKALQGNSYRLNEAYYASPYVDIVHDEAVNNRLRGMLLLRSQLNQAINSLNSEEPFIYGLQVSGSPDAIEAFRSDAIVKESLSEIELGATEAGNNASTVSQHLKPSFLHNEYQDKSIEELDNEGIYQLLQQIVENNK